MDILAKARQLETRIARRLDLAAKHFVRSGARDPLEIARAIVDRIEEEVQPSGRGARVFPFTQVVVTVAAGSDAARARCLAVFESEPTLRDRIAERLAAAGCRGALPAVSVEYVARSHKTWHHPEFDVKFTRANEDLAPAAEGPALEARIELQVAKGASDRPSYTFEAQRIDIGRCREVRDGRNRLIRTNDLAFTEGADAVNQTVSRQHAHITYDHARGGFRLHDDGSAHGTSVVRRNRSLSVPRGARGVRLQNGDEIVLGEARLRVRIP